GPLPVEPRLSPLGGCGKSRPGEENLRRTQAFGGSRCRKRTRRTPPVRDHSKKEGFIPRSPIKPRTIWPWPPGRGRRAEEEGPVPSETGEFMKKALPGISGAFCLAAMAFGSVSPARAADANLTLRSPDERIEVRIRLANRINYDVSLNGKPV